MLISTDQARRLADARNVLQEVCTQARHESVTAGIKAQDVWSLGQLYEAADHAEDAVFNVLNTASSMLNSAEAKLAIEAGRRSGRAG